MAGTLGALGLWNSTAVIQAAKSQFYAAKGVTPWVAVDIAFFASTRAWPLWPNSEFKWKTVFNSVPNNLSSYNMNGITLDEAMVKWDPLSRDNLPGIAIANASTQSIKDTSYLTAALANSASDNILVLATWNDLGEGTGINRNYDYYFQGQWQPPDVFMSLIRAAQSQQSCPPVGTTATDTPTITATVTPTPTLTMRSTGPWWPTWRATPATTAPPGTAARWSSTIGGPGTTSDHSPWTATSGTAPGAYGASNYAACWSGNLGAASVQPLQLHRF